LLLLGWEKEELKQAKLVVGAAYWHHSNLFSRPLCAAADSVYFELYLLLDSG